MSKAIHNGLSDQYVSILGEYIHQGNEAVLHRAYELGRRAMDEGMGVVGIAGIHQDALATALLPELPPQQRAEICRAVEFFADALSPFEMVYRGFEEANVTLRRLNETLEQQVAERTETLQKNHAILAAVTEGTTDAVFVKDCEGRYLMINSAGAAFLGKSVDEVIGKIDTELFSPETARQIMADDRRVMDSGQTQTFEELGTADGVTRTYLSTKGPYRDFEGRIVGTIGISRDITNRQQAEQALRESEQRFTRFMHHLPGLAWIKDLQGRYVYANEAAAKAFGASHAELCGKMDDELFPADTAAQFVENDRQALASETGILKLETLEHPDGVIHHSIVSKFPILGSDTTPVMVGGMAIDITDRKQAEEALQESEARFRAVFDHAAIGVTLADARNEHRIVEANRAMERLLNLDEGKLVGKTLLEMIHPEDREQTAVAYEALVAGTVPSLQAENRYVRDDRQTVWGRTTVSVIPDRAGRPKYSIGVVQDITEQKHAEGQLRSLNETLEQRVEQRTAHVRLLQDVAIIANEAGSIDQAFQASLERICRFAGWPVGHAHICTNSVPHTLGSNSIWYLSDAERLAKFRNMTEGNPVSPGVGLSGRALASGKPVWIADLAQDAQFLRAEAARAAGLRAGFAFPVLVGKEVAAVLEFFAVETTPPDDDVSAMMANVGTQLGRVIERSRAENALRRSEQYYRSLIENAQDMITVLDATGTILYQSPAAQRILGYRPVDLVGQKVFELVHPDDIRSVRTAFLEGVRLAGSPRSVEFRCRHQDGSWRVFESIGVSYLDQPEVAAVIVNSRDVTERKQAEDALRNREKQLAHAQQLASLGSWEWDTASDRITWSDELYEIFGLGRHQFGATFEAFLDRVHPHDRKRVKRTIETALRTTDPFSFDERIVRPDGSIRFLRSQGEVFTDEAGRVVRMFGTCQDITRAKERDAALRESEERFRLIIEGVKDYAIFMLDPQGYVVSWNTGAERIKGYQPDEIIGEHYSRFYRSEDIQDGIPSRQLKRAASEGKCESDGWRVRKDGSLFWASSLLAALRGENGQLRGFAKITRDTTELKEAHERALRAERLAAIGEMIAGISHESRNALQRSQACLERLAWKVGDHPEVADLVCRIRHALRDLHRTYDEVRQYAAPVNLRRVRCHLGDLLEETWKELTEAGVARQARLRRPTTPLDLHCEVDAFALKQVFRNTLENALTAGSDPVEVTVCFSQGDLDGLPALVISIRDNGPGLTPEQSRRIFEPFYTTKTRGTGLGMAITKRIIDAHEGRIAVANSGRRGAEIRIALPRRPQ